MSSVSLPMKADEPLPAKADHPTSWSVVRKLASFVSTCPITLIVAALCVVAHCSGRLTAGWQLADVGSNSLLQTMYRLVTCHLTHWSLDQLFWDVMAFSVLGYLVEQTGRRGHLSLLLTSSVAVSFSIMCFHPGLAAYRGLSGIGSALFAYLACVVAETGVRNRDRLWAWGGAAAWLAFVGKVAYEIFSGQTVFVESVGDFVPLPISHIAGAIAGTTVWLVWKGVGITDPER